MDNKFDRIVREPLVMGGQARIRDTNITVNKIVRLSLDGLSQADILAKYPQLDAEDVHQALAYMIPRLSSLHVNSFQEMRSQFVSLKGWSALLNSGFNSDEVTPSQIIEVIASIAEQIEYKGIYYVVRARFLYPWYDDKGKEKSKLENFRKEIEPYIFSKSVFDIQIPSKLETLELDSRLAPTIAFLAQMQTNIAIEFKQKEKNLFVFVTVDGFDNNFDEPLLLANELADIILRENQGTFSVRQELNTKIFELKIPVSKNEQD